MVAVYGEDRQAYIEVGVLKIDSPAGYAAGVALALLDLCEGTWLTWLYCRPFGY